MSRADPIGGEVLVVEHEPDVAELARRYLARAGLRVRWAGMAEEAGAALTGLSASASLAGRLSAAVVLDLTMPGLDGRHIRGLIRTRPAGRRRTGSPPALAGTGVPVICLTAGEGAQAALALRARDIGVSQDACLTRPFGPQALVAKVLAAIRATAPASPAPAAGGASPRGGLHLDPETRRVRLDGVPVALTATEFDLLACLAREAGRTWSRDRLRCEIWPPGAAPAGRNVDVYVAQLRAKLGPAIRIRTVRGVGYVLDRDPRPA